MIVSGAAPVTDEDELRERFRVLRATGDQSIRDAIIVDHQWIARTVARRFDQRGRARSFDESSISIDYHRHIAARKCLLHIVERRYMAGCDTLYADVPLGDGLGKGYRAAQHRGLRQFARYNRKACPRQPVDNPGG